MGRRNISNESSGSTPVSVKEHPGCYGCGQANASGLRLHMEMQGDRLRASFTPAKRHEGWPEIVHGGIIASLLYEVMENLAYYRKDITMMRSMETRFRSPAAVGEMVTVESWLDNRAGREVKVRGEIKSAAGKTIADGSATLVILNEEQLARHGLA
ncbi:MAG: PaaI family thioesterase [SAR202 cluster bacterium]|nr:PaaI family thioesterase [SAR202 cluster bacterium]HJO81304.1 PaaI family thioesterase [SAR202 cluster bacterium]